LILPFGFLDFGLLAFEKSKTFSLKRKSCRFVGLANLLARGAMRCFPSSVRCGVEMCKVFWVEGVHAALSFGS
jgi:hypothetical protein